MIAVLVIIILPLGKIYADKIETTGTDKVEVNENTADKTRRISI